MPAIRLLLLLCVAALAAPADRALVTIDAGPIAGTTDGAIQVFKGIPYAKPPVGPLRWRPPQPAERWTARRDATAFGAACPQADEVDLVDGGTAAIGEDCLTLNVWAPARAAASAPVMVWLHGGGHTLGAGARRYHDGTAFARDGVVLVSINYRLGALGFFAHPALTREAAADDPLGDFLLMDQIAALRWVKANIHAFGGDPSNVTVFGESAGGVDVVDLLTIASAEGLSQKAIVESAGFAAHSITLAEAEALGGRIAAAAGMHESPITAARLRAIPVADLVKAADEADGPIVDGRLLAARPIARIAAGSLLHVPLMIGTNSDEGSLAGESLPPGDVLKGFSAAEVAALRAAYGGTTDDRALARAVFRDANFAAPSRWIADRASAAAPVFLYRFSYLRRSQRGGLVPGAGHGAEIPYVFDSWRQSPSGGARLPAEDRAEAARVHALWVAFAKTGTPAAPDVPEWPRYSASSDRLLDLGVTATIEPVPDRAAVTLLEKRVIGVDR